MTTKLLPDLVSYPPLNTGLDGYIRFAEVKHVTGLCRSTIYDLMAAGAFPVQVQLSIDLVVWRESEIAAWLDDPVGWKHVAVVALARAALPRGCFEVDALTKPGSGPRTGYAGACLNTKGPTFGSDMHGTSRLPLTMPQQAE